MTLDEAKKEMVKFVELKTTLRPAFVDPILKAEEVVRCKDCIFLGVLNEGRVYAICNKHGKVFYLWGEDAREHYCSWGERKEDE